MEIISTRKVGKRVSPSREFTETRASSLNALGMRMGLAYGSKYSFTGQNKARDSFAGQNKARDSFVGQNGARDGFTGAIVVG